MSFWMELHCDCSPWGPVDRETGPCLTAQNRNPGVLVGNTVDDIKHGKLSLIREAKQRGWKRKMKDGWLCPNCQ